MSDYKSTPEVRRQWAEGECEAYWLFVQLEERDDEITTLRQQLAESQARVAELEEVCTNVHRDLLLRSEPDWDGSGVKVVNLSAGYWDQLCRAVDSAQRLRKRANEIEGGGK